ncbi:MAG: LamG domain-containing protein, partial [Beijerinckiaceae bacterium]
FTDESSFARTLTAGGNAQIDTAQFKYGASSALLDGTGDFVSAANSTDFEFGSGAFTIEMFVRFNSVAAVWFMNNNQSGGQGWSLYLNSGNLQFTAAGLGVTMSVAWTPSTATWYHLCVDRDGSGNCRLYRDGSMLMKKTSADGYGNSITTSTETMKLGRLAYVDAFSLNGWMDEVRITKGVGRYLSDSGYTVPTAAFPRS